MGSMRLAAEIGIRACAEDCASRLQLRGRDTSTLLAGAELATALAWEQGFCVLLTDGHDYEDGLHLHLLDREGRPLDSAHIATPYSTGIFSGLEILGAERFRFRFYAHMLWSVTLFARPRLRPPWPEALAVHRQPGLWRRFAIHGQALEPGLGE